jgi:hypothetical protein
VGNGGIYARFGRRYLLGKKTGKKVGKMEKRKGKMKLMDKEDYGD